MRIDSVSALKATTPVAGDFAELTGYYLPGDGGGGNFYWDNTSTSTGNDGTIVEINSHPATGRWKRVFYEPVDVKWFGAKGDGITDDTTRIAAAIAVVTVGDINFSADGVYIISSSLSLANPVTINLNGGTIKFAVSVTASIAAITINSANVTIKNGTILGTFVPATDTPTPGSGPSGILNNNGYANLVVDHLTIKNVQAYGIVATNGANPTITNSKFINTGYIIVLC
jgi:polygalacturonase